MIKFYTAASFLMAGSGYTLAFLANNTWSFAAASLNLLFGLLYLGQMEAKKKEEVLPTAGGAERAKKIWDESRDKDHE